ncbi:hypothetical protein [Thiomicrorhabdus aquaedulcis]|uniref:hypothetical protein n=1 Tax=Thiomicrorhabdus aquaedulcis TaxID=2211106 RepID=UPI000FD6E083|nr:hypothetical protein [Thiomicrorhabdus aquaedulcis]
MKESIDLWLNPSIPDNSSTILGNEALHQPIELVGIVSTETPILQEPTASRVDNKGESDALSESSKLEPVLMDSIFPKVAESGGLGLSYDDLVALIKEHVSTQEWLATLPSEAYVIQLSTIRVNGALSVMDKLKTDSLINPLFIRVLLDYNQGQNHYRVKVLYFDSMSHPGLVTRVESLPKHLKVSKPYIASVRHILSKLEFTQTQLKQDGIINVNP